MEDVHNEGQYIDRFHSVYPYGFMFPRLCTDFPLLFTLGTPVGILMVSHSPSIGTSPYTRYTLITVTITLLRRTLRSPLVIYECSHTISQQV